MATPFLVGCGIAAAAYTARGALTMAKHVKVPNMPNMPNLGAAAPDWNAAAAAAQQLYSDAASRVAGGHPGGFEKVMTRREAALILGVKYVQLWHAPTRRLGTPARAPPRPLLTCARAPRRVPQGERAQARAQGCAPENDAAQPPGQGGLALHRVQNQRGARLALKPGEAQFRLLTWSTLNPGRRGVSSARSEWPRGAAVWSSSLQAASPSE
jgi:hypothetical protein